MDTDDFRHGLGRWVAELEQGGDVAAEGGVLDVAVPAGATLWWRDRLPDRYRVAFTVTAVAEGGRWDRVSDLNAFWGAHDPAAPDDLFARPRSGAFAGYDALRTYYVGFGGNSNTTTRFRRYVATPGERPVLGDLESPLIEPNRPYRVGLVNDGGLVQYLLDGDVLFEHLDPEPYRGGWFGLRTTWNHLRVTGLEIEELGAS